MEMRFISIILLMSVILFAGCKTADNTTNTSSPGSNNNSGGNTQGSTTGTASVTLSWTAPSTRTDGSSLKMSDIGGYKVYKGVKSDYTDLTEVATITNSSKMDYKIDNLSPGTYYFAVSAYTTNNFESALSTPVPKTIN